MLQRKHPDRIQITFDDRRLVANAGLILPATLALRLGLPELVQQRLDLGNAPLDLYRHTSTPPAGFGYPPFSCLLPLYRSCLYTRQRKNSSRQLRHEDFKQEKRLTFSIYPKRWGRWSWEETPWMAVWPVLRAVARF